MNIGKIKEYIKTNPQLSKLFTADGFVLIALVSSGILAEFGELLPAGIVSILGFIVKIYSILVNIGILNGRENIIKDVTGDTVNEYLGIEQKEGNGASTDEITDSENASTDDLIEE